MSTLDERVLLLVTSIDCELPLFFLNQAIRDQREK